MKIQDLISSVGLVSPAPNPSPGGSASRLKGGSVEKNSSKNVPKDSVEISTEAQKRLDEIKKRIASGYYQGDKVTEDVSDKLGHLFNEMEL